MHSTPEMDAIFSREAHVRAMLRFEAALARAEARAGVIPYEAAAAIAAACHAERFDIDDLYQQGALAGTLAIPLVKLLTAEVGGDAGGFVHWGATSQDAIDTALMLQMREGLALLTTHLLDICAACASLAKEHRRTPMAGRTLLQQALPITFGLKAARWLALVNRQVRALRAMQDNNLVIQFGGAAGTLASLGNAGPQIAEYLAEDLRLAVPDLPWHTERDRIATIASTLGTVAGSMGKIATDIALLAQTEVGEVSEAAEPGKGGSSAMPHKRNSVDVTMALAASHLAIGTVPILLGAMFQEHERAAGAWQAEWEALPNLFRYTASAVARVRSAVQGLEIHPDRMRANLQLTNGLLMAEALTMALAPTLGRPDAYTLVQSAIEHATAVNITLPEAALQDARITNVLSPDALDRVFEPTNYLGSTDTLIDRALDGYRAAQQDG